MGHGNLKGNNERIFNEYKALLALQDGSQDAVHLPHTQQHPSCSIV